MGYQEDFSKNVKIKKWLLWGFFCFSLGLMALVVFQFAVNVEERRFQAAMREIQSVPMQKNRTHMMVLKNMNLKVGEAEQVLVADVKILLSKKRESNKLKRNMPQLTQYIEHELNRFASEQDPKELLQNDEFLDMLLEGVDELFERKNFAQKIEFQF
jgi:hypothetical protein